MILLGFAPLAIPNKFRDVLTAGHKKSPVCYEAELFCHCFNLAIFQILALYFYLYLPLMVSFSTFVLIQKWSKKSRLHKKA